MISPKSSSAPAAGMEHVQEIRNKCAELETLRGRVYKCAAIAIVSLALTILTPSAYPLVITALGIIAIASAVITALFFIKVVLLKEEVENPFNQISMGLAIGCEVGKVVTSASVPNAK